MIRSIFDTEDEKRETKNKIDESPKAGNLTERQIVEPPQNPVVEKVETQPALTESAAPKDEIPETSPENILSSDSQAASDFESDKIVKDIEFGDNFMELEKEVARIEREVRLESEAKSEEAAIDAKLENAENKAGEVKTEPPAGGIFTSAINKSGEETQRAGSSLENLLIMPNDSPDDADVSTNQSFILPDRINQPTGNSDSAQTEPPKMDYKPESKGEIIRKSGLAWSAGIAFFGSVMFLLILGWFAGLLLGNSTWGAVGGVVLGSIIGFIQLFRLTSQILKNNE